MATPASTCLRTVSATAERTRPPRAAGSTGTPSSLANIIRIRSGGRGRLPVCVVRKRSVLRCIVTSRPPPRLAPASEHTPGSPFRCAGRSVSSARRAAPEVTRGSRTPSAVPIKETEHALHVSRRRRPRWQVAEDRRWTTALRCRHPLPRPPPGGGRDGEARVLARPGTLDAVFERPLARDEPQTARKRLDLPHVGRAAAARHGQDGYRRPGDLPLAGPLHVLAPAGARAEGEPLGERASRLHREGAAGPVRRARARPPAIARRGRRRARVLRDPARLPGRGDRHQRRRDRDLAWS